MKPTIDQVMYTVIDAWCNLDGKDGDALTDAEDVLSERAWKVIFTINRRQAERGIIEPVEVSMLTTLDGMTLDEADALRRRISEAGHRAMIAPNDGFSPFTVLAWITQPVLFNSATEYDRFMEAVHGPA